MNKIEKFLLVAVILIASFWFVPHIVHAGSYGAQGIGPIAPTVQQCPAPMAKFALLCPVGSSGAYQMYVSYAGLPYEVLP